jgi:Type I phosphodiesterase / nucleotide pyrophosphatase
LKNGLMNRMGESDVEKVVFLDDFLSSDLYTFIDNGPLWHVFPNSDISKVYEPLSIASKLPNSHFQVWLHKDIPTNLHYNSHRVGPILILTDFGYNFAFRNTFDKSNPPFPKGIHGWNITQPDMSAILIGSGPYFEDYPKRRGVIKNVEVYGMLAEILGIKPNPNNGTGVLIRNHLPLDATYVKRLK